jgi:hypothetical protein
MTNTLEGTTVAARVLAGGGGGFKEPELDLFHELEVKERALATDGNISESRRTELRAELHDRTNAALHAAESAEVAAARKPIEDQRAQLLAEIKRTVRPAGVSLETTDAQRERLTRRTIDALISLLHVFGYTRRPPISPGGCSCF